MLRGARLVFPFRKRVCFLLFKTGLSSFFLLFGVFFSIWLGFPLLDPSYGKGVQLISIVLKSVRF